MLDRSARVRRVSRRRSVRPERRKSIAVGRTVEDGGRRWGVESVFGADSALPTRASNEGRQQRGRSELVSSDFPVSPATAVA